ncbi:sugar transferase [Carboxylicivirga taeanensis]|uniref:sugar transferase n=1 Tax=Carboxylicivirga taeanensis TaxID=1416875 RepID=UPI003F6E116F
MRSIESISAIGVSQEIENTTQSELAIISSAGPKQETKAGQAKEALLKQMDIKVYDYIAQHVIPERESVRVMDIYKIDQLDNRATERARSLINIHQINDVKYINKFLKRVNANLPDAGLFIGCIETVQIRKRKLFANGRNIFKSLYWFFCFIFHRVMPKIRYVQKVYFGITKGKFRWLTMAEMLGRLVSCGFEIIEYKEIEGKLYFVVMKTHEPTNNQKPSFGPLFAMNRIGKNGKLIKVYKLRTMHPYSEFLQDFVVKLNGYNEVGKPANDFRLADWGRLYRKYWLDEIPQFINVLKGELAIVGVRPLSQTRFNELPEDVRQKRIRFKPGCIPPYVALNMPDSEQNIEAERIYMAAKEKAPFLTDVKYFIMAVYNILTGKIKSS